VACLTKQLLEDSTDASVQVSRLYPPDKGSLAGCELPVRFEDSHKARLREHACSTDASVQTLVEAGHRLELFPSRKLTWII